MSDSALRIVLTHELFHLAARVDTALDAPLADRGYRLTSSPGRRLRFRFPRLGLRGQP